MLNSARPNVTQMVTNKYKQAGRHSHSQTDRQTDRQWKEQKELSCDKFGLNSQSNV